MKIYKFIIISSTILFLFLGCSNDVVNKALLKDQNRYTNSNVYDGNIIDFKAVQGKDNREIILTWVNPIDSNFDSVILLKKIGSYPSSYDDSNSTLLYNGANQKYTDSNLNPNNTYYYAIYSKSKSEKYSTASFANKAITETIVDIRRRSFFIIGGTTSYPTTPQSFIDNTVDMFDPITETMYQAVTVMPNPRYFCAVTSANGKIYVMGGFNSTPTADTSVDILNVDDLTWSSGQALQVIAAPATAAPRAAFKILTWNGIIYPVFGTNTANAAGSVNAERYYSTNSNTWYAYDADIYRQLTTARCTQVAEIYNGIIYYWGGVTTAGALSNTGYYYNLYSNSEVAITVNASMTSVGATSLMYHKNLDNGDEIAIMFVISGGTIGASSTNIPNITTLNTSAGNNIFMLPLPSFGGTPNWVQLNGSSGTLNISRAYAGAESYGDYIYIIGGTTANGAGAGTPEKTIEKLNVNNGNPTQDWITISTQLRVGKYGFSVTKVNY